MNSYHTPIEIRHQINISEIKDIRCVNCKKIQKIRKNCIRCKTLFGLYYCKKCKLYDDIDRKRYHCNKCGYCIIEKNTTFHCNKCNLCIPKDIKKTHICNDMKELKCPICMDTIFIVTDKFKKMKCGHYIHNDCLKAHLKNSYKCPICFTTIIDTTNIYKRIDEEISNTRMGDFYANKEVKILCNDCHKQSIVNYHIVALKCNYCGSYNSRKI